MVGKIKSDTCDICHEEFIMCDESPDCNENCVKHHRDMAGFFCSDKCWCIGCGMSLDDVSDMPLATKTEYGNSKEGEYLKEAKA